MAPYTWRVMRSDTNSTLKKDKGEGGRGGRKLEKVGRESVSKKGRECLRKGKRRRGRERESSREQVQKRVKNRGSDGDRCKKRNKVFFSEE